LQQESVKKVVFLPNPIDPKYNKIAIDGMLKAVHSLGCRGLIKLHPSEENRGWYENLISDSSLIDVSQEPMTPKIVSPGDVVLVSNSTAGIEAVLFGAHIANIIIPGMPNPIPYEEYGVGFTDLLKNTAEVILKTFNFLPDNYSESQQKFLELLLFRLDGKASNRLVSEITQLIN